MKMHYVGVFVKIKICGQEHHSQAPSFDGFFTWESGFVLGFFTRKKIEILSLKSLW